MKGFLLGLVLGAAGAVVVILALRSPERPSPPPIAEEPVEVHPPAVRAPPSAVPGPRRPPGRETRTADRVPAAAAPRRSETPPTDPEARKELNALVRATPFPHADFAGFGSFLGGEFVSRSDLPERLVLTRDTKDAHLSLPGPLRTGIVLEEGGAVYARDGVAEGGAVSFGGYTGVAVKGAMAGRIEGRSYGYIDISGDLTGEVVLESYAYLHVGGSLAGKVTAKSYATVVLDGDLTGTLTLSSSTTLVLRGRVLGTLDEEGCPAGTFYFNRFVTRSEMETIGGAPGIVLHARESDLPAGRNAEIAKWKEVVVADPFWEKVPR